MSLGTRLQWWIIRARPLLALGALLASLVLAACNSGGSSYGTRY
jgi:hypothetical protein